LCTPFPFAFASLQRGEEIPTDASPGSVEGEDVDPALDLVRTMSMSTDKDILKQLRDAMNPKQRQQTFVMILQAGLGLIAVAILLAVVIVGYLNLVNVSNAVGTMAEQTTQLKDITLNTSKKMNLLVENLGPVKVLPDFEESLSNMNEQVDILTTTLCSSPLFAAQCPADLRGGAFAPAPPAPEPAGDELNSSTSG